MWFPLLSTFVELTPLFLQRPVWLICTARYVLNSLNISSVRTNFETFREPVTCILHYYPGPGSLIHCCKLC